ncbi:MAG: succinate dehydrogenase assembly factor 2 [Sulfitobacter sp.]|nr:succinate dehydrogenase assembly factor 2 [Sulfitobacter sp.]
MSELREHKIKRLHMRSMRRGIKEMDLILSTYAGARLEAMTDADLTLYDALLNENDHDLYQWVTGQTVVPATFSEVIADIRTLYSQQV